MTEYFRPVPQHSASAIPGAQRLAGGWCQFDRVERLRRGEPAEIVPLSDVPTDVLNRLCVPRQPLAGVGLTAPRLMGILNVTPDSFSDGGDHAGVAEAVARAREMAPDVDVIDIGGESTRPGAAEVGIADEISRTVPVISAIRDAGLQTPISIDTRKAPVARAALDAGADIVNDVSGLRFDRDLAPAVAQAGAPLVIMHSVETPETMQEDPSYGDVVLDVYDFLAEQIETAVQAGIPRDRIVVDPGIGFGKTLDHNLALLSRLSLFHGLGCPILLGASRKRFVGTVGRVADARARAPGSIAVALAALGQGVQILRIHDTAETRQALRLYWAAITGQSPQEE